MSTTSETKTPALEDWMYRGLFQQVPFNVAIIDQDYNIVNANDNFTEYFGPWRGKKCYRVYKKLSQPCLGCNARLTFEDGQPRVSDESGVDQHGQEAHYVVHIAPLRKRKGASVKYIVEMSRDIVETKNWQMEYQLLFERVPCYITVIDRNYKIIRANENFRRTFGDVLGRQCFEVYKKRRTKCPNCPAARTFRDGQVHRSQQVGIKKGGDKANYVLTTSPLGRQGDDVAHVIEMSMDITDVKKLQKEVIEAERLSAVGQTVAGLAHSIKNILMGLEGGMYIMGRGLQRNDREKLTQGWDMLERNFNKTTSLVRDFLSFAKGRMPELEMVKPNALVEEIIDLYQAIAAEVGVTLTADLDPKVGTVPLDPKGIHTCLTNLVSNAIDACEMSDNRQGEVTIATSAKKGAVSFTVTDNGTGMDSDIKRKVFTTFFTTKGGKGTGLGLLTTRRIVKEHGGHITVRSISGQGTRFRISFPKSRLTTLYDENKAEQVLKQQVKERS
ncbi:MAG: PAS domain-containing protein [candidate division Zixibacteria bacterium]|nr:PAS domain-containing protein [candidate division Zixibacteria bacterium]